MISDVFILWHFINSRLVLDSECCLWSFGVEFDDFFRDFGSSVLDRVLALIVELDVRLLVIFLSIGVVSRESLMISDVWILWHLINSGLVLHSECCLCSFDVEFDDFFRDFWSSVLGRVLALVVEVDVRFLRFFCSVALLSLVGSPKWFRMGDSVKVRHILLILALGFTWNAVVELLMFNLLLSLDDFLVRWRCFLS